MQGESRSDQPWVVDDVTTRSMSCMVELANIHIGTEVFLSAVAKHAERLESRQIKKVDGRRGEIRERLRRQRGEGGIQEVAAGIQRAAFRHEVLLQTLNDLERQRVEQIEAAKEALEKSKANLCADLAKSQLLGHLNELRARDELNFLYNQNVLSVAVERWMDLIRRVRPDFLEELRCYPTLDLALRHTLTEPIAQLTAGELECLNSPNRSASGPEVEESLSKKIRMSNDILNEVCGVVESGADEPVEFLAQAFVRQILHEGVEEHHQGKVNLIQERDAKKARYDSFREEGRRIKRHSSDISSVRETFQEARKQMRVKLLECEDLVRQSDADALMRDE